MSIVGIFTQSRPMIDGFVFDAILEESTELVTDVTEFPVETGAIGNDHAVQRPLRITMRVGVSDNAFRAATANASDALENVAGIGAGLATGAATGALSGSQAVAAGLGASVVNAAFAAGQAQTRSQSALDAIREVQKRNRMISIVASKRIYERVMITSTRQETRKENERGLELVVELQQILAIDSSPSAVPTPAPDDPAETQGAPRREFGRLGLR